MTHAATLALMSAALCVYVAALSRRFALAPGWRDQQWFALAALCLAAFSLLDGVAAVVEDPAVVWAMRLQLVVAGLHQYAWLRYSEMHLGLPRTRLRRALAAVPLTLAVVGAVPGTVYLEGLKTRQFAWLGLTYRDPVVTPFGQLVFGIELALFLVLVARYLAGLRRGVSHAALHLAAVLLLMAFAANDALAAAGLLRTPSLLELGFMVPVAAVGWSLTTRFAGDARDLSALRERLERLVEARTEELARALEALHRSEKLAALGQFAAGVAHEVNNPSAVVTANLKYLAECRSDGGPWPPDTGACFDESLTAMERISRIIRQLIDAGRVAAQPEALAPVALAEVARESLRTARARCGDRVALVASVPEELRAVAQDSMLVQVLVNLVVNAAQAVPDGRAGGRVELRGERAGEKVRLTVEDNGAGMTPEVLRRVFEPFFSTKPVGGGTGLGLAVSRGLVQSMGGTLLLTSEPGRGTRAVVELPAATGAGAARTPVPRSAPAGPRRRLLLVDDEPAVLRSLGRVLAARYTVDVATGVGDGLGRLERSRYDLVLCDLMMPEGGGERLYRELARRAPQQAARLVFITGGATSEASRRFLAAQPQPVLEKPIDLAALAALAERAPAVEAR
jgi:signal transduction histidine kinase/CheY-like chemotaxis protein